MVRRVSPWLCTCICALLPACSSDRDEAADLVSEACASFYSESAFPMGTAGLPMPHDVADQGLIDVRAARDVAAEAAELDDQWGPFRGAMAIAVDTQELALQSWRVGAISPTARPSG